MLHQFFRLVAIVTLAMLVASCALLTGRPREIKAETSTQFILHVDENFTPADRAVVIDSFSEWERDTHGIVRFLVSPKPWTSGDDMEWSIDDEDGCTVEVYVAKIDSTHKTIRAMEKGKRGGNTLGFTQHSCEQKLVAFVMDRIHAKDMPADTLRFVGVHEAGHLIGLDHIPVPEQSVMFPSMDHATRCPTKLDMAQFCLAYGCDAKEMISCEK